MTELLLVILAVEIPLGFLTVGYGIRRLLAGADRRAERARGLLDALLEVEEDKQLPQLRQIADALLGQARAHGGNGPLPAGAIVEVDGHRQQQEATNGEESSHGV